MATDDAPATGGTTTLIRALPGAGWLPRIARGRGWRAHLSGRLLLVALTGMTLLIGFGMVRFPGTVPLVALTIPLLLGSQFLGPRQLPGFVLVVVLALMAAVPSQELTRRVWVAIGILLLLCAITFASSLRRSRLGVAGMTGEAMLVDLRDRILAQGTIPSLPVNWYVDAALQSAGGSPFAGDFIVTGARGQHRASWFDVVLVDVSGKGEQAGTRALLLSGAMGGLLAALSPAEFLVAANEYLLRQAWDEGFATAIHLSLHLPTGRYELRTAGHPPAVHLAAGSGRWSAVETEGPVLGVVAEAEFPVIRGELRPGDALLLYTDGMVETPTRDITLGTDRLTGQAERLLRGNFERGAARLVEAIGSQQDDRALLLVHRR